MAVHISSINCSICVCHSVLGKYESGRSGDACVFDPVFEFTVKTALISFVAFCNRQLVGFVICRIFAHKIIFFNSSSVSTIIDTLNGRHAVLRAESDIF